MQLPSQKVLSEIMNVFFHKKPSNESYVEWSRKDGEQIGGKVFSEHNDIILKKITYNLIMNTETLQINIESPIATVTLNRPNVLNAFNEQLVLDLQQAFKSLTEDESVRVIILTGSGKGFCGS